MESLQELFEAFVRSGVYLRAWSPRTVETYRLAFASLQRSLPEAQGVLTKAQLEAWIVGLRQRNLSAGACNVYIRGINSFCSWLHEQEHTSQRLRLKLLPCPRKPLQGFSDAEVRALLAFKPKDLFQARTWTLINLLFDTGIRIDEALTLTVANVDLDNLIVTVTGKGNKTRKVPISLEGRKVLFRFFQTRPENARLVFCACGGVKLRYRNVYRDLKALCAKAGVEGEHVHPHAFRHCFAVSYIRRGGDIYRLSRILGHTNISTTQIYLRSMGVEMIQEGHERLTPLARLA